MLPARLICGRLLAFRCFVFLTFLYSFSAFAQNANKVFNIEAQPLSSALQEFADVADIEYIAASFLIKDLQSSALKGEMSPEKALEKLLLNTGLMFKQNANGVFLIKRRPKLLITNPAKTLEETFVTALKRTQPNQDVPVAVVTLQGEALSKAGKTNTRELFMVVPSVSYHGAISSAGQGMRIRGFGTGIIASGIEQSVGSIIDGVVTGSSGSGLQEMWDVERIEVLKGPQGTMFGKNVSAGAISQVTADPTDSFAMKLKGRYEFEYDGMRLDSFVSDSPTEEWSYRLSGFYFEQDKGTVENIRRDEYENLKDHWGIRGKLFYESENWWAKLNVAFDRLDESCCARVMSHIDGSTTSGLTEDWLIPAMARYGVSANENNRYAISEGALHEQADTTHSVVEFGRTFESGHVIKSISGYRKWDHQSLNDADNIDRDIFSIVGDQNSLSIQSQEIQFLSPLGGDWEYLLGLYFFKQDYDKRESIGGGLDFSGSLGETTISANVESEHVAAFGHVRYQFSSDFAAFAGLRLMREEISAQGQQRGDHWLWPTDYPVNSVSVSDTDYVGTLGIQYLPSDDSQVYFNVSRGYKSHAIDNPSNAIFYRAPYTTQDGTVLTAEDSVLDPEIVLSYELGTKNYFFDHTVLFNVAMFLSRFKDFQDSAFDGQTSSFHLLNAGEIESKGVEVDFRVKPWTGAEVSASLSWIDAIFKDYKGAPCQVGQSVAGTCGVATGGQDLSGQSVSENPEWQYYIGIQQNMNFGFGNVYFNGSYSWRDDVIIDSDLDPNTRQEDFGLLDLRAGLETNNYEFALFVNNATNEDYATRIIDAPLWRGAYQRYPGQERTYGIEVTYFID